MISSGEPYFRGNRVGPGSRWKRGRQGRGCSTPAAAPVIGQWAFATGHAASDTRTEKPEAADSGSTARDMEGDRRERINIRRLEKSVSVPSKEPVMGTQGTQEDAPSRSVVEEQGALRILTAMLVPSATAAADWLCLLL